MFSVDYAKFQAQIAYLTDNFRNAVEAGLDHAAQAGADKAKTDTFYTPRSSKGLQSKTKATSTGHLVKHIVANTFYASWVNFGNGPPGSRIYPTKAKCLRFKVNGVTIFRRSVKASAPRPFMSEAAKFEESYLETAVSNSIKSFLGRV